MSVPADLVVSWATGWMACRDSSLVVHSDGVIEAFPRSPLRDRELIVVEGWSASGRSSRSRSDRRRDLVSSLGPTDWLTLVGESEPPERLVLASADTLMTTTLTPSAVACSVIVQPDRRSCSASVRIGGALVASGTVAVSDADAVFDRIDVDPSFQRQGWGTAIMAALTTHAVDAGASRGILVASLEGRLLYERLGWSAVCPVTSYAPAV